MLKRLMERLSGNRVAQPPTPPPPPERSSSPGGSDLIKVYDGYGREVQITRADWRDKMLLPNVKAKWDMPDALYGLILSGLKDGVVVELLDAGKHLRDIDPQIERGYVTYGIILLRMERLEEAEAVFREGITKVGETGALLTNLAKIEAQQGQHGKAEATLWRAIERDPNLDHGLLWWMAIHKERGGEEEYVNALARVTALPDSWRAQLHLARHYLQKGDTDIARAIYEEVLATGKFGVDALLTISGDLGNNGQTPLIVELVAPMLDLQKHDVRAGLNVLQAYLQLRRLREGEALLSKLYALNIPPYKQHLDHYAQEFQRLRDESYTPAPVDEKALEIVTVPYDRPVWMYGLRDPSWLFAKKDEAAKKVVFLPFSQETNGETGTQEQRENNIGRLTRTLPMYLAESVHAWSDYQSCTMIPVVRGGGPVVFGASNDDTSTVKSFQSTGDVLVLGTIGEREGNWHVSCRLWSVETEDWIAREEFEASPSELAREVLKLEQRILTALGGGRSTPLDAFYERPPEALVDPYLAGLGQSLTLSLIANQLMSKDALWGERNLIEWWLRMALNWPRTHVPRMAYLAAIANAAEYESSLLEEFTARTRELMKESERINSPASKLAPVAWKAFGMMQELDNAVLACGEQGADDVYSQWLDQVINHQRQPAQETRAEGN
jgi:tetratricopeptide (TPR) repeat protein